MARINKELVILVGRDRENPRTHREAFEITDGLGEMLDKHIKRNNLNKSEFIREAVAAKLEAEMPEGPLILDEKVRKALRLLYGECPDNIYFIQNERYMKFRWINGEIFLEGKEPRLKNECFYTIDELCGEGEE